MLHKWQDNPTSNNNNEKKLGSVLTTNFSTFKNNIHVHVLLIYDFTTKIWMNDNEWTNVSMATQLFWYVTKIYMLVYLQWLCETIILDSRRIHALGIC